jgi:hypothetical protein
MEGELYNELLRLLQGECQAEGLAFIAYTGRIGQINNPDGSAFFNLRGQFAYAHVQPTELAPIIHMMVKGYANSLQVDPAKVMRIVAMHLTDNAQIIEEQRHAGDAQEKRDPR